MVTLDPRLRMLSELLTPCDTVADIGTDHGFLGVYLLQRGLCRRVQFLDISSSSLDKARRLVRACGLEDRALFNTGDGAEALVAPAEQVVIAGMGAESIIGIVERGRSVFGGASLILQPNLGVERLREALGRLGYTIADERVALASGRHYVGLRIQPGEAAYTPGECLVGPVLMKRRDEALVSYARFRLKVLTKARDGASRAEPDKAARYDWEISVWREIVGS